MFNPKHWAVPAEPRMPGKCSDLLRIYQKALDGEQMRSQDLQDKVEDLQEAIEKLKMDAIGFRVTRQHLRAHIERLNKEIEQRS